MKSTHIKNLITLKNRCYDHVVEVILNYLKFTDKYLHEKSDPKNSEFDIFIFALRNIKEIEIPSSIKIISSLAFDDCKQLSKVDFASNSNLQTNGESAFISTNFYSIKCFINR